MKKHLLKMLSGIGLTMILLCTTAYAKSPVGQYNPDSGRLTVSGVLDDNMTDDVVNILVLNKGATYTSFTPDDVIYIGSQEINQNREYQFHVDIGNDFDNSIIYIKAANEYTPITAFKTKTENVSAFARTELFLDNNVLTVGASAEVYVSAYDDNGTKIDIDKYEICTDNSDCVGIDGDKITGITKGNANIYAKVTVRGKTIATKMTAIAVRNASDTVSIVGTSFYNNDELLNITGDISTANRIVFAFNAPTEGIVGIKMTALNGFKSELYSGVYDAKSMSYTINLPECVGFGKYRFDVLSDEPLGLSSVIEGCDVNMSIPETVAVGYEYNVVPECFNYRNYKIDMENVSVTGTAVIDGVFCADAEGEYTVNVSFIAGGQTRHFEKKINAVNIDRVIAAINSLRMEPGDRQNIMVQAVGEDGNILDIKPTFVSSNAGKISVSEDGEIYAKSMGTAEISVICADKKTSFRVFSGIDGNTDVIMGTAIKADSELELNEKQKVSLCEYMLSGDTYAVNDDVEFTSDDESVLQIDEDGNLIGKNFGKATISTIYAGEVYKKKISVVPRKIINARIVNKSGTLPIGRYDSVRVLVNSAEYLSLAEYRLYSDNEDVIKINGDKIQAVGIGTAKIKAVISTGNDKISTEAVEVTVYNPEGGYLIDEIENSDKMHYIDPRLVIDGGEVYTKGASDKNAEIVYYVNGDINDIIVYDHICNPTYESEDIILYVSPDNLEYQQIEGLRIKGEQLNGWGIDVITAKGIPEGMRYLKIIMNNPNHSQATRVSGVEVGYSTAPKVLDVQIVDDCTENEIYKNILGQKAVITFNQPINPDSLANISVDRGDISDLTYDAELYRCEFVIKDKSYDQNRLNIKNVTDYIGKTSDTYSIDIKPLKNMYSINKSVIYEVKNGWAERISIQNDTVYPKTYSLIECMYYDDGRLMSVKEIDKGQIDAASHKYIYCAYNKDAKLLIWESIGSMKPIIK